MIFHHGVRRVSQRILFSLRMIIYEIDNLNLYITFMEYNYDLTGIILKKAYEVHTALGPGLLESTYEECLCYELSRYGLQVERQKTLPIEYKGIKIDNGYRLDIVVENKVVIELKSVETLLPIHSAQLLTYLKLSNIKYGLLINFNVKSLKEGIKRYIM